MSALKIVRYREDPLKGSILALIRLHSLVKTVIKLVVVVVYIVRYFRLYLQRSIRKIKKREEAEPQGQALAKRTCRGGAKRTKKKC